MKSRIDKRKVVEKNLNSWFMTTAILVKFNRQSFANNKCGGLKFHENRGTKPAYVTLYCIKKNYNTS